MLYLSLGTFVFITHNKWVFPYIAWYSNTAYCHNPFGYSGVSVLWYSVFVGLPIFCAVLIGAYAVPIGIKGLKDHQFPPKGMKVFKPTKIIRGWKAKVKSFAHLLLPLFFVGMGVWGFFQAGAMQVSPEKFDYTICEP